MKKRRLNGWHRLGILASVIWLLEGGYHGNMSILDPAAKITSLEYQFCMESPNHDDDACHEEFEREWKDLTKNHWKAAALEALVPIPFAWFAVYGVIWTVRWVRRGFADSAREVDSEITGSVPVHKEQQ